MTELERSQYYAQREAYRWKCQDFKKQLDKYLNNYEIQRHSKKEIHAKAT